MVRIIFMGLLVTIVDIAFLCVFAWYLVEGKTQRALITALAGAALHAMLAPTREEFEELQAFIAHLKK